MMYWIAQGFGLLGLIVMVISLFQKDKDKMLNFVVLNGLFFGIEYLLLKAFSGMFSNFFGILRTFISKEKEKKKGFDKQGIMFLFILGYMIIGFISFDGKVMSLLPVFAEIIYVITLWQKNVKKIRIGTLLMVLLWLVYDIFVKAYPSLITDLIVMSSTIIAIYLKDIRKKEDNNE